MNDARLYVMCGLPGAGKTTRAKRIADSVGALFISADEWLLSLGQSLVDYELRFKLQDCLLQHTEQLLQRRMSVVLEFGSWDQTERETIRRAAERAGATTELHYLAAPLDELARRVRQRGGPHAEFLATTVLTEYSSAFEPPDPEEIARFDYYVGPDVAWEPG